MAIYAIGDVQGCYKALMALLDKIQFDIQKDRLWFTGDLVNRGPQSREVLQFVINLGDKAINVLGNHDLHYLAVAAGAVDLKKEDTFQSLLEAKDATLFFDWMRYCPLAYAEKNFLMVHAGIAPEWNKKNVFAYAHEIENILRGSTYHTFLKNMYGNTPAYWDPELKGEVRFRVMTHYFTRVRYIDKNGHLALQYKGVPGSQPAGYKPWFKVPLRLSKKINIIFGHWAALEGKTQTPRFFALDTGCVWGKALTALRLEDLKYFSVKC